MSANPDLLPDVQEFCRQNGLLPAGGRIIVGLSGGPDSLALLDLLLRLAPRHGLTVVAAHLNHCLRGAESDADETAVRSICAGEGVRLYVRRLDIAAEAAIHGQSTEEAGRRARYAFFDTVARTESEVAAAASARGIRPPAPPFNPETRHCLYRQPGEPAPALSGEPAPEPAGGRAPEPAAGRAAPAVIELEDTPDRRLDEVERAACLAAGIRIAVGHHRNDQAETVLLNLVRGSGIDGLAGMRPQNGLLIRPLLDAPRAGIDAYVRWRGLAPCIDASNFETEATRNRLRHRVLPALNEAFGFDAVPALARAARILRQDAEYLQQQAAAALEQLRAGAERAWSGIPLPGQAAVLPVKDAAALHPAILARVLRLWYRETFGDARDLSESQVAGLAGLCLPGRSGRRCSLPHGRQALRDFSWLVLLSVALPPESSSSGAAGSHKDQPGLPAPTPADSPPAAGGSRPLRVPGITEIPGGGYFVTQFIVAGDQIVYNYPTWCFQASELTGSVVRHRLPHDRFQAEGSSHAKSLKKFLCERQVPAVLRDSLPLIARNATVLWIPGVAASGRLPAGPGHVDIPPRQWVVVRYIRPGAAADGFPAPHAGADAGSRPEPE